MKLSGWRLYAVLLGLSTLYLVCIIAVLWLGVRYLEMSPNLSVGYGTLYFLWPLPGVVRMIRQLQHSRNEPALPHESTLLVAVLFLGVILFLILWDRFWWLLPIVTSVCIFTLGHLCLNSRPVVAWIVRLDKRISRVKRAPKHP